MLEYSWHFTQNDNAGALKAFDEAINLKPKNSVAWRGRGIALLRLGRFQEALDAFDRAINQRNLANQFLRTAREL